MRNLYAICLLVMLTGCATVQTWIPSFWDDNQSAYITDARLSVERINCAEPQTVQVQRLREDLRRFQLYSEAKGSLQKDVIRVIEPMQTTAKEWAERGEGSKTYCEIKKRVLAQQGERAAKVILGRW
jgi:flagellar basal body L-ring protein FlgH